ncbi:SRPBCC family protein [Streptomyces olivaceiscleroticus]|uniref:SRPBCC family protein n=1 Tax=Streptomyces olivaceiscleroticus TaxID=68245 RepID=A0ABP3KFX0_9ACTN
MPDWPLRPHHYRFRSRWLLDAPPGVVYAALEYAEAYPQWWPQIAEARRIDARSGTARIRSVLPFSLRITVSETRRDPVAGILQTELHGDVDGWARWTITPHGSGTRALYEQEVEVRRPFMRWLAYPGRPFFRLNHALMMRAGRRGLAARLDGRQGI